MLTRILKLKLIIGVVIVLALVLLQTVSAYIFGIRAQDELNMQFKKITNSPYIVVDHYNYDRGFFSSNVSAEISLNSQVASNILKALPNINESAILSHKYSIKYTMHITHGIFAGVLNGKFVPTLATAKVTIQYPDSIRPVLTKFFGDKNPLYIKNIIYLNGSGQISVTSPSFNYEEALSGVKMEWYGLNLITHYNKDFNHFNNKLSIPHFSLNAPTKGEVLVDGVYYKSNSKYSKNQIKVGDTNVTLDKIKVNLVNKSEVSFRLGDFFSTLSGVSATEFLNELDVINPAGFTLSKFSYTSASDDVANYFNAMAKIKFESLVTESNNYGPFDLSVSANHILSAEFSRMIDDLTKLSVESNVNSVQGKNALVATLKKYFAPILVDKPLLTIDNLQLNTPSGLIKLYGSFTTSGFILSDINNEQDFVKKLSAKVYFSVPRNVLSYLFLLQMQYFLSAGNAEMDKQSSDALKKVVNILLDNQLTTWKKRGYIKADNGILSGNLIYENGKLTMKP